MQERTALESQLTAIGRIQQELDDQVTLIELGEAEKDQSVVAEAEEALKRLKTEVSRRELEALLSGEADVNDSYVEVHAGAGGTESQDWANMLLRMYTRWAEQHGYKVEYLEETQVEEAGIKSATVQIKGRKHAALERGRGPARQQDRIGDPPHPHPDQYRGLLPERPLAAPQSRAGLADAARAAL